MGGMCIGIETVPCFKPTECFKPTDGHNTGSNCKGCVLREGNVQRQKCNLASVVLILPPDCRCIDITLPVVMGQQNAMTA